MPTSGRVLKRLLVGRAMQSDRLGETLLPKKLALPVFASDALSSVAYAPDEIFLTLGLAGGALALTHSWQIALGVVLVMVVVVASYRQNVRAYPSGGGDYEVATVNLGPKAGLTVASSLLVDYVLTVAVSISSGVQNAAAALPFVRGHEVLVAVGLVAVLTTINLRGVKESGAAFAAPTYLFMVSVLGMAAVGMFRHYFGTLPQAESASLELVADPNHVALSALAMAFLMLRAFSSGCAALTGVEAISNGVPAFQKPKSRNAATTLLLMGVISITMLLSMIALATWTGVKYAENPAEQLLRDGKPVGEGYVQETIMGQVAHAVFNNFHVGVVLVSIVTGLILILAANTAFNGFPVLASILAKDGWLPRQLHTRGDRLAFSNGIVILASTAAFLIVLYNAQVTKLIQLYIVGVFVSFTLSQTGMIRHWNRHLRLERDRAERARMQRSRVINAVGAAMSGTVLLVVLATKFIHGAGYAIAAMVVLFFMMLGIRRHYDRVRDELRVSEGDVDHQILPSRVHAIVLVSKIHKPTLRALAYARATRPSILEAITVNVEPEETKALQREWDRRGLPVALKALDSPFREITRPVVDYVKSIRSGNPRDVVVVYIPEYVLGRWYEQVLHNQSAPGELSAGDEVEVEVGPVAHGGHCVARHQGRVVFVRHALPGETVRVRITEARAGQRFVRGDAVEVLEASAHRVQAPCPYAGPGLCGGCDFQHVDLGEQRRLKAAVVREQFARLAGLDVPVEVEAVPGDREGLGWRTRVEFAVDDQGTPGLRRHRSHDVLPVADCLIAHERVRGAGVLGRRWPGESAVDVVAPSGDDEPVVVPVPSGEDRAPVVHELVRAGDWDASFEVGARGFWQVHPGAASTFVGAVLDALAPLPGERAVDLYAGVGLFALALADAVGPDGAVLAVEAEGPAMASARRNTASRAWVEWRSGRVDKVLKPLVRQEIRSDLVVLDPPRTGAGRVVTEQVARLRPRAVAYVACDPAALARDTAYLKDAGYGLRTLRAFDAFPMTHHIECVAVFEPLEAQ